MQAQIDPLDREREETSLLSSPMDPLGDGLEDWVTISVLLVPLCSVAQQLVATEEITSNITGQDQDAPASARAE